jgi:hypothetical protein
VSWPSVSLGLGALLLLGACASLAPEGYPLDLSAQGLRRTDLPAGEGTQWDYILVIKNPNRRPATLIQEAVTLGWDGVYRSEPVDQTRREVPARGHLHLPKSTVFRRSEFEAPSSNAPGRPTNAPARAKGMWILWQFLGRHDGGGAIVLDLDFFPDPAR